MTLRKPVLAALAVALLFLAYRWDRGRLLEQRRAFVQMSRLIPFDYADATAVRVENDAGVFALERRGPDEWAMTEPRALPADAGQVRTLVDNLHASKRSEPFEPGHLADYGLDRPSPRISVRGNVDGAEREFTLLVGGAANRIGRYFAKLEGEEQVFTVGDWIRNQGLVGLQELRDKTLMRFSPGDVTGIRMASPGGALTIERTQESAEARRWWISEMQRPASESLVDLALRTISSANAVRIEDNPTTPAAELGLAPPAVELTIALADGREERLALGRKAPEGDRFYARTARHAGIALVRAGHIEPFLRPRREWGTRRFLWAAPASYSRIETASGTLDMKLGRDETGNWVFEDSPGVPIHPEKLALFLDALANWTAKEYVTEGLGDEEAVRQYGLRPESYKVLATRADGTAEGFQVGLTVGAEGFTYVRRVQDNSIWKVSADRLHFVRAFRADLQDKRIQHGWAAKVARIDYKDEESGGGFTIENRNGVWMQRTPGYPSNVLATAAVPDLLHLIEELEWESFSVMEADAEGRARLEFRDAAGELVYWFEELRRPEGAPARDAIALRTPNGIFDVRLEGYKRVFDQWLLMLRTAREEGR